MKFVVDKYIPYVESVFGQLGEVIPLAPNEITTESMGDAEVIIIRSETRVSRGMLDGTRVKFVGTSTIGTDHIDTEYLTEKGIGFANAPGSNANSVAEYVVVALLNVSMDLGWSLKGKTLGIVGVGNIGSKVARYAEALGMIVLQNDPPLARSTGDPRFVTLDDLMTADVVTIHVPLTKSGVDKTHHLFDGERIQKMKQEAILINTSRGGVVKTGAIKQAIENKHLRAAILDVWENEPSIDCGLLKQVEIGTAHIAGYSLDGKVNAVKMIYDAVCQNFSVAPSKDLCDELPAGVRSSISVDANNRNDEEILRYIVSRCYDIRSDDEALKMLLDFPEQNRSECFARLRSGYRIRREFANAEVAVSGGSDSLLRTLGVFGFKVLTSAKEKVG